MNKLVNILALLIMALFLFNIINFNIAVGFFIGALWAEAHNTSEKIRFMFDYVLSRNERGDTNAK